MLKKDRARDVRRSVGSLSKMGEALGWKNIHIPQNEVKDYSASGHDVTANRISHDPKHFDSLGVPGAPHVKKI